MSKYLEQTEEVQVTISNTLSKDFMIDYTDKKPLVEQFLVQDYSAKEALDAAEKFAAQTWKLAQLMKKKYPNIAGKLAERSNWIIAACMYWNEDEIEGVLTY